MSVCMKMCMCACVILSVVSLYQFLLGNYSEIPPQYRKICVIPEHWPPKTAWSHASASFSLSLSLYPWDNNKPWGLPICQSGQLRLHLSQRSLDVTHLPRWSPKWSGTQTQQPGARPASRCLYATAKRQKESTRGRIKHWARLEGGDEWIELYKTIANQILCGQKSAIEQLTGEERCGMCCRRLASYPPLFSHSYLCEDGVLSVDG